MTNLLKTALILTFTIFLSSCLNSIGNSIGSNTKKIAGKILPNGYQKNLYQGLVLTPEIIDKIKIGMSKNKIKNLIGSPTIIDPFHKNRWDYINKSRINGKTTTTNLVLFFSTENILQSIKK